MNFLVVAFSLWKRTSFIADRPEWSLSDRLLLWLLLPFQTEMTVIVLTYGFQVWQKNVSFLRFYIQNNQSLKRFLIWQDTWIECMKNSSRFLEINDYTSRLVSEKTLVTQVIIKSLKIKYINDWVYWTQGDSKMQMYFVFSQLTEFNSYWVKSF